MRIVRPLLSFLLTVIALVGWFGVPSNFRQMNDFLFSIDNAIQDNVVLPSVFGLAIGAFFGSFVITPIIRKFYEDRIKNPLIVEFNKEFDATSSDRLAIASEFSKKYRHWRQDRHPERLTLLLERVDVPGDLPLAKGERLIEWASAAPRSWEGDRRELWRFILSIYPPYEDGEGHDQATRTLRQSAVKFWNKWGLRIKEGQLGEADVADQIGSSVLELKLLTYVEIGQVLSAGWNEGPGKTGLFDLARRSLRYER